MTDEKYLQWQCKSTCDLCNVDPSKTEIDEICDSLIPENVKQKYKSQHKAKKKSSKGKANTLNFNSTKKDPERKKSNGNKKGTIEYFDKTKNKVLKKTQDLSYPRKASAIKYYDKKENRILTETKIPLSRNSSPLPFTSLTARKSFRVSSKSIAEESNIFESTSTKHNQKTQFETSSKSQPKSSRGFVVINDPERRRKLRSFWMRAG